eukprot:TRINITY_DN8711_c0_g1_i1.p1 TRINITY_DN8711_c0_g1~~TRINITY_DN8711_c0_g1_i1.p1  ORF type:complete len:191 (+),score=37.35 TRINITY_DN8711_c0_g1_i1:39-611(+)
MKTFIFLLALLGASWCYSADIETIVCETWRGWGEGLTGEQCAVSIKISCAAIFDVVPELIEFFKTFDFSKIGKLFSDLYITITESIKQWSVCKYMTYFANFFPHLIRFFSDFWNNFKKIQMDAFCVYASWVAGDYYAAGICLGHIFKVILASQTAKYLPNCQVLLCSKNCLLYTSPSPRDATLSRMPSSA